MDENKVDKIFEALDLIASILNVIANELDPEALEKRRTALLKQLAHDLAEDSEKES